MSFEALGSERCVFFYVPLSASIRTVNCRTIPLIHTHMYQVIFSGGYLHAGKKTNVL